MLKSIDQLEDHFKALGLMRKEGSTIQLTPGWVEAVAALLYNEIYDLCGDEEGAWTTTNRRDEPDYLAFAEGLLYILREYPDATDTQLIDAARGYASMKCIEEGTHWSNSIVIDQEYHFLTQETDTILPIVRGFIESPPVGSQEQEFILQEEIAKEEGRA